MTQPTVFISYSHKDEEKARQSLAKAKEMIGEMGYTAGMVRWQS